MTVDEHMKIKTASDIFCDINYPLFDAYYIESHPSSNCSYLSHTFIKFIQCALELPPGVLLTPSLDP